MSSILLAIIGYFLTAIEAVFSKFLLTGRMRSWQLYVFYIGIFSLFSLVFFPLGLHWYGWPVLLVALFSGVALFFYLAMLYQVLARQTASFVYVFSGAISVIGVMVLSVVFLDEAVSLDKIVGVMALLFGGLLVAIDLQEKKLIRGTGMIIGAGVVFAVHLVSLKYVYLEIEKISGEVNFVSGYIYSRLGEALATVAAFASPGFRKEVFRQLGKQEKGRRAKHLLATVFAKSTAGLGTLLVNVAIAVGSVTVINAMMAVQYLFVFVMSVLLTFYFRQIFAEKLKKDDLLVNAVGVALVVVGVVLVERVAG